MRSAYRSLRIRELNNRPIQASLPAKATSSRSFSSTQQRAAVEAAAPYNFSEQIIPTRVLPASPSYFTASPQFNDSILHLQSLVKEFETLPTVSGDQAPRRAWVKYGHFKGALGEPISAARYSKIIALLQRLNRIQPRLMPPKVKSTMKDYLRASDPYAAQPPPPQLDGCGRARAIGRRKTSTAQVFLVEGSGEVLVNGKSIVQAFPRIHDRESALWALKITKRIDKYNVWALVGGGGVTGQAESVTLALARALLIHEPGLKPVLRRGVRSDANEVFQKAGCVTVDPRQVERKKPGRLKARKKPAWVKR
ncbi:MAG: hypothetical protein Q9160_002450 [Pyrenula sp. 1 TL-2023]